MVRPPCISLRLDDGQVIGQSQVLLGQKHPRNEGSKIIRMSLQELNDQGKLKDKELKHIKNILQQLEKYEQQQELIPDKKQKQELAQGGNWYENLFSQFQSQKPQNMDENSQEPAIGRDVYDMNKKFGQIINKILQGLGYKCRDIFEKPVDPHEYPSYYEQVKKPMDLGKMRKKTENNEYKFPEQFREDMLQVWTNCKIFNHEEDFVYTLGTKMEGVFENLWIQYGFGHKKAGSNNRSRRQNAGQHSQKLDQNLIFQNTQQHSALKKGGKNVKAYQQQEGQSSGKNRQSNEVSSGEQSSTQMTHVQQQQQQQLQEQQPQYQQQSNVYPDQMFGMQGMSEDNLMQNTFDLNQAAQMSVQNQKNAIITQRGFMSQELKEKIANMIESNEEIMEGALAIIQKYMSLNGNEDGEVELEMDQIDDATLWSIYDFLVQQNVMP